MLEALGSLLFAIDILRKRRVVYKRQAADPCGDENTEDSAYAIAEGVLVTCGSPLSSQ